MSRLVALASAVGDRVNPVAVKEFRQAVQSRWVISIVMLFLLINLAVVGGYLMLSPDAETSISGGREIFMFLYGVLLITCVGFVPMYSGWRLSLERNDANIDLLFITTITPGAIVRGKYLTAMALTLLIYSACMPFMVLTYLLRGIDLPTIFLILASGFMVCAAANAMGILAGCIPSSWFIRGVVTAGMLFFLFYWTAGAIAMAVSFVTYGAGWFSRGRSLWGYCATFLLIEALVIGLLHVLSVAMLSPKPSNRMLVPRLYIMGCWMTAGAVAAVWSYVEIALWPVVIWAMSSGISLMILTVAALGERDTWSSRVRRTIPRNPLLRLLAFLLYTGSAGGIAWCALLFTATMAAASVWCGLFPGSSGTADMADMFATIPIIYGYVLCYCLTTAFFRSVLLRSVPTPNLSVFAAFFGMAVCLAPYLVAFFVERNWWHVLPWYLLGSPMVLGMDNQAAKDAAAPLMIGWLVLGVLLSAPWAFGQWQRFVPYQAVSATPSN